MIKAIGKNKTYEVSFDGEEGKGLLDGIPFEWDVLSLRKNAFHVIRDGYSYNVEIMDVDPDEREYTVKVNGRSYTLRVKDRYDELLERLGMEDMKSGKEKELKAPMPGLVLNVLVKEGQGVSKGEPLVVLEAMKMENVLKAPGDGVIGTVAVAPSQAVEKDQTLIEFE